MCHSSYFDVIPYLYSRNQGSLLLCHPDVCKDCVGRIPTEAPTSTSLVGTPSNSVTPRPVRPTAPMEWAWEHRGPTIGETARRRVGTRLLPNHKLCIWRFERHMAVFKAVLAAPRPSTSRHHICSSRTQSRLGRTKTRHHRTKPPIRHLACAGCGFCCPRNSLHYIPATPRCLTIMSI